MCKGCWLCFKRHRGAGTETLPQVWTWARTVSGNAAWAGQDVSGRLLGRDASWKPVARTTAVLFLARDCADDDASLAEVTVSGWWLRVRQLGICPARGKNRPTSNASACDPANKVITRTARHTDTEALRTLRTTSHVQASKHNASRGWRGLTPLAIQIRGRGGRVEMSRPSGAPQKRAS